MAKVSANIPVEGSVIHPDPLHRTHSKSGDPSPSFTQGHITKGAAHLAQTTPVGAPPSSLPVSLPTCTHEGSTASARPDAGREARTTSIIVAAASNPSDWPS